MAFGVSDEIKWCEGHGRKEAGMTFFAFSASWDFSLGYVAIGTECCFCLIRPVSLNHWNCRELVGVYGDVFHLFMVYRVN